ncbi:tripartite tricarboxylate transporter substrate binding protein [Ramlibacter sp. AW1]|uniref:Tripartite tricarboxylate transporter substrate binding protein n=1 Tax=Ramlibacter aurantiacus TaxID=2801330 RepID=A0A936ZTX8_9BURK|nr:tripartite tricarboxylate transporter substrate binding protein [Ramlibacter aurantiacus]MBL0421095.1 tripartite tricarboxylate transporter substrate binding protein [Ramlibacter aurantiacus]
MNARRRLQALLALAMLPLAGTVAAQQEFPIPNKPIRIVVGFPAGGGTDLQARLVGQHLSQVLNVPVVIENKPGAGTMLAAMEVQKAVPDGHTLLYTPSSTLAMLPHSLAAVKYDTFKDFTPVSLGALGPLVLVLHKSIPAANVRELVAWAKANPGKINYVSQGVGTSAHLYGEIFARQAGIDMVHVPYKGANDVAKDFISGRVHLQFASSSAAVALAKTGEVRMIGVVAGKRSPLFSDLPTMGEQGVSGVDIESWVGYFGPAGMPPATVRKLNDAIGQVLKMPKLQEDYRQGGAEAKPSTPEEFARIVRGTYDEWAQTLQKIGYAKQ